MAVSFFEFREQGSPNWMGEMPFGVDLPVLALGFGLLFAGAVRAVVRTAGHPHRS